MKLVYYTYRKISLLLFVLMAVWGVLFYYAIIDEVVDETDDTLENYAEILIEHVLHDSSLLETEGSLMSFYKFRPISEQEGNHYQEVFYDSTVYIELEDEYGIPHARRTVLRAYPDDFHFGTGRYGGGNALVSGGIVPAIADLYIGGHSSDIERGIPPVA